MHGGVGHEVLQKSGLRDAACQKGEKTKKFSLDSSSMPYQFLQVLFRASVCALNVKTKLACDKNRRCSSLSELINSECVSDRIFLLE